AHGCHETICPGRKALRHAAFGRFGAAPTPPSRRLRPGVTGTLCKNHWTRREKAGSMPKTTEPRNMATTFLDHVNQTLDGIRADGFWKAERKIATPQDSHIRLEGGQSVLNFCANNYLGLADDKRLIAGAREGLDQYGFGMASVRFICGTQTLHKELEAELAKFLGTEDSILYSSCFDAN